MEAVRDHPFVTVRSSNGVGKDWVASEIALWWLYTRAPSIVITTAPTNRQVEQVLWGEIRRKFYAAKVPLGGRCLNLKIDIEPKWYAIGFSTDKEDQFQGFHGKNILFIFSEAQGIPKMIYEATKGCLTSEGSRWLLIGNPMIPTGDFYDTFKSPLWHKIKISSFDSPNVIAGKEVVPGVVTKEWVDQRRVEYGEDHPFWFARVLGEFPPESEDTLIPLTWIEQAKNKPMAPHVIKRVLGLDVARYGGCETVGCLFDGYRASFPIVRKDRSLVDTAGDAMQVARESEIEDFRGKRELQIFTDDIGVGGGVTDILDREGYAVTGIVMNAKADNEEKFFDLRAECYWDLREAFRAGTISIPDDEKLVAQLAGLRYEYTTRGAIRLISKEKLRKEGMESPDRADALAMAVWGYKHGARNRSGQGTNFNHLFSGGRGGY